MKYSAEQSARGGEGRQGMRVGLTNRGTCQKFCDTTTPPARMVSTELFLGFP